MILFHGTNMDFYYPDISACKPGKDFGDGFYLADNQQQAEEFVSWKSSHFFQNMSQYVNTYLVYDDILDCKELNILRFDDYDEKWVDFVYEHRQQKSKQASEYDIIYGPVADGDMKGLFPKYEAQEITKQELLEGLKNTNGITYQYYFGTEKAIAYLKYYCTYELLPPNAIGARWKQYQKKSLEMIDWTLDATTRIVHNTFSTIEEISWTQIRTDESEIVLEQNTYRNNKHITKLNRKNFKKIMK